MNKRGDIFSEELVKIVLAVIGIFFLFIMSYSLYNIFFHKTEIEQAKAVLAEVDGKIKIIQEGIERKVVVTAPKNWEIVQFSKGELRLKECLETNCLCMCKNPWDNGLEEAMKSSGNEWSSDTYLDFYKNQNGIATCEKTKICVSIKNGIDIVHSVQFELSKRIEKQVNWISLENLPKNIYLKKEGDKILISEKSSYIQSSLLDNLFKTKFYLENSQDEWIAEGYVNQYANCSFESGKVPAYFLEHYVKKLDYIFPGKEKSETSTNLYAGEKIMILISESYIEQIKPKITSGSIQFNFVSNNGEITTPVSSTWGCCGDSCKCNKIQEEKLICSKDFKTYLRLYVP